MAALPKIRKKTTSSRPPLRAVSLPPVAPPPRRPSDYPPPPAARRESSGPHRRSDLPPPAPLPARLLEQHPRFSDDVPTARRSLNDLSYAEETATERLPNGSYDEWTAGGNEEDIPTQSLVTPIPVSAPVALAIPKPKKAVVVEPARRMAAATEVSVSVPVVEVVEEEEPWSDSGPVVEAHFTDEPLDDVAPSFAIEEDPEPPQSLNDTLTGAPRAPRVVRPMTMTPAPTFEAPSPPAAPIVPAFQRTPAAFQPTTQPLHPSSAPAFVPAARVATVFPPMPTQPGQAPYAAPQYIGPVLTPGLNLPADMKVVHRAPWFCLGLMVGVAFMVAALFLPTAHDAPVAAQPAAVAAPQGQVAQGQVAQGQVAQGQVAQGQGPLAQGQGPLAQGQGQGPLVQSQLAMPSQPEAQGVAPAAANVPTTKPMPTVDVHTLPVAGQKPTAAPARHAWAPRAQPAHRAAPPKAAAPPSGDEDSMPQPIAKPAPAPAAADSVSSDMLLQAL